jgi:hypothetical protein
MKTDILQRLAAKRAGKYSSPFKTADYSSRWGGEPFKVGENVGYRSTFGRWHESPETPFRFIGLAHKIAKLRHTGWFTRHEEYSEIACGVVYLLPHGRFIAAIADPCQSDKEGRGPCIVEVNANGSPCIYESQEEAARAADEFAERYAESSREDDRVESERQAKEQEIEDAKAALADARKEARELLTEIRASKLSPGLCERMKREFRNLRRDMREALQTIHA